MRKFISVFILVLIVGFSQANAQSTAKKAATDVKTGAVKAGNKTAELAAKGKAGVTDQVYKDKEGPQGQTIYIDNHSKYYWIDKKGHKVYIKKNKLVNKQ